MEDLNQKILSEVAQWKNLTSEQKNDKLDRLFSSLSFLEKNGFHSNDYLIPEENLLLISELNKIENLGEYINSQPGLAYDILISISLKDLKYAIEIIGIDPTLTSLSRKVSLYKYGEYIGGETVSLFSINTPNSYAGFVRPTENKNFHAAIKDEPVYEFITPFGSEQAKKVSYLLSKGAAQDLLTDKLIKSFFSFPKLLFRLKNYTINSLIFLSLFYLVAFFKPEVLFMTVMTPVYLSIGAIVVSEILKYESLKNYIHYYRDYFNQIRLKFPEN